MILLRCFETCTVLIVSYLNILISIISLCEACYIISGWVLFVRCCIPPSPGPKQKFFQNSAQDFAYGDTSACAGLKNNTTRFCGLGKYYYQHRCPFSVNTRTNVVSVKFEDMLVSKAKVKCGVAYYRRDGKSES